MGKVKTKRFSKGRNKKDTWKKLQHPDLDEFLRVQREDERFGIKEKTDDQLFVIDQQGSDSFFKAASSVDKPRQTRARKVRNSEGPLVDLAGLKCFEILKPHSAVKDPVIKRNRTRLPGEKKSKDMKLKDEIRRYKQEQVKIQAADSTTSESDIVDPWSAPDPKSVASVLTNEWLSENTKRHLLHNRSIHRIKKPTTQLKAIEAPHPGLSVNPSFTDHQDILKTVVEMTKSEIKREQKLIRATAVPKSVKEEDGVDIKEEEDVEVKSEPESDTEDSKNGVLRPKPKTRQQKRKARELLEQQKEHREGKEKVRMEADVYRVKSLKKQIVEAETKSKKRLQIKVDKKLHHEKFGQLDLSRHKYKPVKPDPLLSDEIGGSLLTDAKNSIADLTLERFKSLQKRNLIEPTVKQRMQRKYKRKRYQRPSEKMEWEVTGMWNGEKLLNPGDRRKRGSGPPRRR